MTERVALVTGAARGQGAAIVRRLVADGFRVAACDLDADELRHAHGSSADTVLAIRLDVRSADQWDTAVTAVIDKFGALSVLTNNAGVLHRAALAEETAASFEDAWRVNCLGPFLGIQATLAHLRREAGAIVNICSTSAIRPFPNHVAYGSSKWALRGMTQVLASELSPLGIRVNAVFPGPIDTPMLDALARTRLQTLPTGRMGTPSEVADAVSFLASERASFITGSELVVDGGQTLQIG